MTDTEVGPTLDLNVARRRMKRRLTTLRRNKTELEDKLREEPVETLSLWWISDVSNSTEHDRAYYKNLCEHVADNETSEDLQKADEEAAALYRKEVAEFLMRCSLGNSMKTTHSATQDLENTITKLTALYDEDREKNYSASLKVLKEDLDTLKRNLADSPMEKDHPQRQGASKVLDRAYLLQTKLAKPPKTAAPDVKPDLSKDEGLGGLKMAPVNPPTFSGEQKDWQAFWSEFKAIHETSKYTASNKLGYLRQAQKDPEFRRQISQNIDNGDPYDTVIEGFRKQFDRPRSCTRSMSSSCCRCHKSSLSDPPSFPVLPPPRAA